MLKIRITVNLAWIALVFITATIVQARESNGRVAQNVNPTPSSLYSAGAVGPHGGKVFYVDASGQHGLEAKIADEMNTLNWHDAVIAVNQYGNGWRLPTITELEILYTQRALIGGFANDDYWSSTEQDQNSAWIQGFFLGDQDRYNKYSSVSVRAINDF